MLIVGALMWPIGAFGLFPIVGDAYSGATEEVRRSAIQSHGAIWTLQQLIFLSGAVLVGFGEVRLERLYRDRHKHRRGGFAKAMVGFMGEGLIGYTVRRKSEGRTGVAALRESESHDRRFTCRQSVRRSARHRAIWSNW
jgi:hypothetical protein